MPRRDPPTVYAARINLRPHRNRLRRWLASHFYVRRGCWVYSGSQDREYPEMCFRIKGVRHLIPVHILAFRVWCNDFRVVPAGFEIHHECGNTWCYNPGHLELMDAEEHQQMHRGERFRARLWQDLNEATERLRAEFGDEPSIVSHYRSPAERRMSAVL